MLVILRPAGDVGARLQHLFPRFQLAIRTMTKMAPLRSKKLWNLLLSSVFSSVHRPCNFTEAVGQIQIQTR